MIVVAKREQHPSTEWSKKKAVSGLFILLHQIKHFIALERNTRKGESCFRDSAVELLIRGLWSEVWLCEPCGRTTFSKENLNVSSLCSL